MQYETEKKQNNGPLWDSLLATGRQFCILFVEGFARVVASFAFIRFRLARGRKLSRSAAPPFQLESTSEAWIVARFPRVAMLIHSTATPFQLKPITLGFELILFILFPSSLCMIVFDCNTGRERAQEKTARCGLHTSQRAD